MVPPFWHRLYLDTADLIDIADDTTDAALVDQLLTAMDEHLVVLVVSNDHFQDALRREDLEWTDRFATTLERFRLRTLVTTGPHQVEPWPVANEPQDIVIEGCSNIREIITSPAGTPYLETMREAQDAIHNATVNVAAMRRDLGEIAIPKHQRSIALQSTITQVHGWMGNEPVPVVLHHLEEDGGTPSGREIANLLYSQLPVAELLNAVQPLIDRLGFDRLELVRRMACSMASDGYTVAPGSWLGAKLQGGLIRNTTRTPLRSDAVDALHAMHYPYVDIASCDAQAHAILSRLVGQARGPRPATVVLQRNGRLADIVDHIRQLPSARELYERHEPTA
jgi:hypothetical protein